MSLLTQFLPKKETLEFFLTLSVNDQTVRAAVAQVTGRSVTLLGTGVAEIKKGQDIEAADLAISNAEKHLPSGTLVEHVVFALPQSYLDGDSVKPEYVTRLKRISRELSLTPKGFIEFPQAIAYFLEKEESSPPTLLLISINPTQLTFSLIRVGKIQQHIVIPRGESLSADMTATLPKFTAEILPSRILLYDDGHRLDTQRSELLKFPWHKNSSFLHTPKVEIFPETSVMSALVEAASSSFVTKTDLPDEIEEDHELPTSPPLDEPMNEELPLDEEIPAKHTKVIMEEEPEKDEEELSESPLMQAEEKLEEFAEETFGFVKGVVDDTVGFVKDALPHYEPPKSTHKQTHVHHEELVDPPPKRKKKTFSFKPFSIPSIRLPHMKTSLPIIGGIMTVLILVAVGGYFTFYALPKATVTLIVYPLIQTKTMDTTFTTDSSKVTGDGKTLLATAISQDTQGDKSAATTGTNNVGDRAKGEITIYNKTLSSKTFPKGLVLSNGDLKFTLDEEASVASASDNGEGLSFGKKAVKVTAVSIGPSSNLNAGSSFTLKDFPESSYTAKNTQALSGGSARQVQSVSKEDQTTLERALTQELTAGAKKDLLAKIPPGETLIDSSVTTKVTTKKFSADVGNEAKSVTLTMTVTISALTYRQDDLKGLIDHADIQVPSGYAMDPARTRVSIVSITPGKSDDSSATVSLSAFLLPQIQMDDIKAKLVGKPFDQAQAYLQTVDHIGGVRFTRLDHVPIDRERLPRVKSNLTVNVTSD